MRSAQRVGLFL